MAELTVVVPAFAERDNLPKLLAALEPALAGIDWEAIIVVDDAFDGSEDLVRERAQRDDVDIVIASRYMEGGSTGELAAERVRMSRLAAAMSRVLGHGLSDPMSGFFVVRRRFLERVVRRVYGRGFK